MPDDRHRIERFASEVRTDISFGERMERYCRALGVRLCREIEAATGGGRFVPAASEAGHERLVLEGARRISAAIVQLTTVEGTHHASGLTVDVMTDAPTEGRFHAALEYQPVPPRFEGSVSIQPASAFGDAFESAWRNVCRRHVTVADFERFRRAFDAAGRPDATGLLFSGPHGPFMLADEYTFLFVRDAGRALLATAAPLLAEGP